MITADSAYIKKINRNLILSKIIEHGMISRTDLSKITGLNKATISVQVANLITEKLIIETKPEHNIVGRRPIMLSINQDAGYVLGIDLDYHQIQYTVANLMGKPVHHNTVTLKTSSYEEIVHLLIKHIKLCQKRYASSHYGLVSVMIGIHGTVSKEETIHFVPTYQWKNKNLKADLQQELNINISIENNANLSTYAERVFQHHESNNLLCIILSSGIGAGIMINGKLHKGFHGYAGEMGHMIIAQSEEQCRCGNYGCWELYASEPNFYHKLSQALKVPEVTLLDIMQLINKQDQTTMKLMEQYISDLSIGLNNIINLYNPETLVLASELLQIYPNSIDKIEQNFRSSTSQYGEIVLSKLGYHSSLMGACALAIEQFLEVPELILTIGDASTTSL